MSRSNAFALYHDALMHRMSAQLGKVFDDVRVAVTEQQRNMTLRVTVHVQHRYQRVRWVQEFPLRDLHPSLYADYLRFELPDAAAVSVVRHIMEN